MADPWILEDADYPLSEWKLEVQNDDTRLGYWVWVLHRREAEADERPEVKILEYGKE